MGCPENCEIRNDGHQFFWREELKGNGAQKYIPLRSLQR